MGHHRLCYRDDLVTAAPDSWNDLLTPRAAVDGKTTMLATERWLVLPAQKALGYSVNTTDDDEIGQVKELLSPPSRTCSPMTTRRSTTG